MCRQNTNTNTTSIPAPESTTLPAAVIPPTSSDDTVALAVAPELDIVSSGSDTEEEEEQEKKKIVLTKKSASGSSIGRRTLTPKCEPMTRAEVLEKSDPKTLLLIIVHDKVYDCTRWQHRHPGSFLTIAAVCGKDATDAFLNTHPRYVGDRVLNNFYYADLQKDDVSAGEDQITTEFRALTQQMEDAGMFQTNYSFYYKKAAIYTGMFLSVLAAVLDSESIVVHALAGCLLGCFWQQMAYVGHDLGHNAITHNINIDSAWGLLVGNLMTGVSMAWWKRSHNVHHVVPNSVDYDPDIQHLPVMAIDPVYVEKPVFSTYQMNYLALNKVSHLFVRYQHWLYFPIMAVARINLYALSILHAFKLDYFGRTKDLVWHRELQIAALAGFWTWMTILTMQLPTWQSQVAFLIPAHVVAGFLHIQITISHFAMPTHEGVTYDNAKNGFLPTQLAGTMDIKCPEYMDWLHAGIQFQVVHHVWPRLPRHNLRKARTILMAFCNEHGLDYQEQTFFQCVGTVMRKLKETSKSANGFSEMFADSINLQG